MTVKTLHKGEDDGTDVSKLRNWPLKEYITKCMYCIYKCTYSCMYIHLCIHVHVHVTRSCCL